MLRLLIMLKEDGIEDVLAYNDLLASAGVD